jgi:hypothetical protein
MGDSNTLADDDSRVVADAQGRLVDRSLHEHTERLAPNMYEVRDGVWCLVGNGALITHRRTAPWRLRDQNPPATSELRQRAAVGRRSRTGRGDLNL